MSFPQVKGVTYHGPKLTPAQAVILTEPAIKFVAALHRTFNPTRLALLHARQAFQKRLDTLSSPSPLTFTFPPETAHIRNDPTWICAPPAKGLEDRRVEITGGVGERKMVVNALNCGAKTFMADFEDANSPTFANLVNGQVNLRDAVRRQIDFESGGKKYKLVENPAVLIVRPRGWHLEETRIRIDNKLLSGSIFDFALYFYHNAKYLLAHESGPYFYLPKMEHYLEARLWSDIFYFSQSYIGIPVGSIRATVLIETLPAAFMMEEILWELRVHSSGLNCGRWDYIFSFIKRRRAEGGNAILPDRKDVTMEVGFMDAYVRLLIKTCHKRKVAAMGGMSAQIPIKNDSAANELAMSKVRADKLREVRAGHDGTWIAHPLIRVIAQDVFDAHMLGPNQYHVLRNEVVVREEELLNGDVKGGRITEEGVKGNVFAALAYCAAWVTGNGCIPINGLMEDAATAEIARVQLWQWVYHGALLDTGEPVTKALVEKHIAEYIPSVLKIGGVKQYHVDIAARYLSGEVEKGERKEYPSEFLTSDLMKYLDAEFTGAKL
ncbi:malate synthase [Cantharellus anzutake]|uniref:malate synthase n=1 Tax=Cantharellus anzutake TaxID=1750568 RepID=UPI001906177C|nr:malate synthase [Cantharellus anzutake]KAF8328076.1 malate synthase [Cantharellus anzutake]